jgi:regulator of cell morphogenesis and NO signaling
MSAFAAPLNRLESAQPSEALPAESGALIDYILQRYHETHRREFDELIGMARRVEAAHAGHPDLPEGLSRLLQEMQIELNMHMCKEEHVLFPLMNSGGHAMIGQPISMMLVDHEDHLALCNMLEETTAGCIPPLGACATWRRLYAGIRKLIDDLNEHIRIENTVLFPRFTASDP